MYYIFLVEGIECKESSYNRLALGKNLNFILREAKLDTANFKEFEPYTYEDIKFN